MAVHGKGYVKMLVIFRSDEVLNLSLGSASLSYSLGTLLF